MPTRTWRRKGPREDGEAGLTGDRPEPSPRRTICPPDRAGRLLPGLLGRPGCFALNLPGRTLDPLAWSVKFQNN